MTTRTSITALIQAAMIIVGSAVASPRLPISNAIAHELQAVRKAQALYALTNRERPTYRRLTREIFGITPEGGEVVGYYRGSDLRIIEAEWFGETDQSYEQFYFDAGKPVFMYRHSWSHDHPENREIGHYKERFYFDEGRIVRWLDERGRPHPSGAPVFKEEKRSIMYRLQQMLHALASSEGTYQASDMPPR